MGMETSIRGPDKPRIPAQFADGFLRGKECGFLILSPGGSALGQETDDAASGQPMLATDHHIL